MIKKLLPALALIIVFTPPAFSQEPVWDGNKVMLESQKLADGVYAVIPTDASELAANGAPIATTGGFIVGDKGVLVIESMLNKRLADQMMALVRAKTDKPIRWLVNTSYHGDHSYGNYQFPKDVTIIQHVNTKAYVERNIEHDKAFMIQNFGKGRGIEEVLPRTGDILVPQGGSVTLDLGGQEVIMRDFGFAQTGGDLFVWHPAANVIWTGNPIVSTKPALPWLLDGHLIATRDTLVKVHEAISDDTRVVPGHGPVTDRSAIKWNIDYLAAVRRQVKAAIDDGLTLEQTVEKVQMPEFGGYALFGWVHPGLNIPAAYKDLSD
jgi:glyoxylase-like metal-dependent hydrolase (beta-lactamase superfamily II)